MPGWPVLTIRMVPVAPFSAQRPSILLHGTSKAGLTYCWMLFTGWFLLREGNRRAPADLIIKHAATTLERDAGGNLA